MMQPQHGGQLQKAARQFNIPPEQWLDLSTGINPFAWTPPPIPQSVWQRLPDSYDALHWAAQQYYGRHCIATPGSQWLIQGLPENRSRCRAWIPQVGYEEYRYQWQRRQHTVMLYPELPRPSELQRDDVVIVINPNNPTGKRFEASQLIELASVLEPLSGCLIVDEAFMDPTPEESLLQFSLPGNIVVLRSIGKFFGLAGIRLGFAHCTGPLLNFVEQSLGPWGISHPAAYLGEKALLDQTWQRQNRQQIHTASEQLAALLRDHFSPLAIDNSGLFCSLQKDADWASRLFRHCAKNGVLIRLFEDWNRVRFGLCNTQGLQKLDRTLGQFPSR
ncbi:aminotransferase class I/II-fold pyridoxal phosphate-dependent enzyme [Ketobacter sp. MCCC 1A13808]|uniref:threonine-phosphate decarboxylase n=1 Tax=Ketobacter sp. MCCC 1A13808 TaxID=2602738 RepID=UPI0012ECAEB1|nr:threonine-phosphate decarboxylase [Ketobacter sp. MCCC 1A13808]MVF11169.1 aminotransferase class I/II-fold pyridoxal phosphate-dependent enzyme [Ketobacter sp. MCCC 1A13808]